MTRSYLPIRRWVELGLFFGMCYCCGDILVWAIRSLTHDKYLDSELRPLLWLTHLGVLSAAALIWTLARVSRHPIATPAYRNWLRTTPWKPGMPLPLGPTMLVWSDAAVVGIFMAIAHWHLHVPVLLPLTLAWCGFALGSVLALAHTFGWGGYVNLIGLAFFFRCFVDAIVWRSEPMLAVSALLAAGLAVWTQFAIARSLRGFPWEKNPAHETSPTPGWLSMIPRDCKPLVSVRVALAWCAFVAVWMGCILSFDDVPLRVEDAIEIVVAAAAGAALIRVARYYSVYRAPMPLFTRVLNGRLVLPGYHYALLAPAATVVVGAAVALVLAQLRAPAAVIASLGVGVSFAIALIAPPTYRNWQLTGFHRRVPFRTSRQATGRPIVIE